MKIMQVVDYATFAEKSYEIAEECARYADIVWFRIKGDDVTDERVRRMREAVSSVLLSLSLNAELADRYCYDAVHLGADSNVDAVREKYPNLKIGYSAHSTDEIKRIRADYYTLSPIFFTQKEYEVRPLGVLDVSDIGAEIYALGGITAENAKTLKGYSGVAGISFYKNIKTLRSVL